MSLRAHVQCRSLLIKSIRHLQSNSNRGFDYRLGSCSLYMPENRVKPIQITDKPRKHSTTLQPHKSYLATKLLQSKQKTNASDEWQPCLALLALVQRLAPQDVLPI